MAVDTILLSYCEDCDVNDGVPQYAPKLLLEAIGLSEKQLRKHQAETAKPAANKA